MNTLPIVKHGSGSVMLWGFACSSNGKMQHMGGKNDSGKYLEILEKHLLLSVRKLMHEHTKHTSKSTKAWLQKKSRVAVTVI